MSKQAIVPDLEKHFALLGVAKAASLEEVKTAYRKLARQCHPDLNPGQPQAEDRFKEISAAYENLLQHFQANPTAVRNKTAPPKAKKVKHNETYDCFVYGFTGGLGIG